MDGKLDKICERIQAGKSKGEVLFSETNCCGKKIHYFGRMDVAYCLKCGKEYQRN